MNSIEKNNVETALASTVDHHGKQSGIKLALDGRVPFLLEELIKITVDDIFKINVNSFGDEEQNELCYFAYNIACEWWEQGGDRRYIPHIYAEEILELDVNERLYLYQELKYLASCTYLKAKPPVAA